jgi:hypothetical protein
MILAAPAGSRRALPALLAAALISLPAVAGAAGEEDRGGVDWRRDWIPSVGLGGGFLSRENDASIGGGVSDFQVNPFGGVSVIEHGVRTDTNPAAAVTETCIQGQVLPANAGLCEYFDEGTSALDGFVLTPSVQLLAPALNPLPLRPRLLFQGGYGFPYISGTMAADGFKPISFEALGAEPKVRIQLKADQQSFWWVGGGLALQLPFDAYRTWLKLSVSYSEEEVEAVARIDTLFDSSGAGFGSRNVRQDLLIQSISPGIGLEAEVGSLGPMSVSISFDTLISIALQNDGTTFTDEAGNPLLFAPNVSANTPGGPILASYQPDDIGVFGGITVRFNWIGFER